MWATGKGVDKDTQAKAAAAVAEWEKLRAKSHAKSAAKKTAKMSAGRDGEILCLANTSFNTDLVRKAWAATAGQWEAGNSTLADDDGPVPDARVWASAYIRELWTDFIIVEASDGDLYKVHYEVGDPDSDGDIDVSFDDPVPVKVDYVEMSTTDMVGAELTDAHLLRAVALTPACQFSAVEQVLMSAPVKQTPLNQILALAADKETGNQYGNVAYADTKNKKYPIGTAKHVRAAWSYFNQGDNQKGYSPAEVAAIKSRIKAAAKKFDIEISD